MKDDKEDEMMLDPAARALAGATVLGLAGTVAVVGAQLTGINMFRAVTWNPADFQVAFVALAPVTLLELFLFGVEHKVPQEFWQRAPTGSAPSTTSSGSNGSSSGGNSRTLDLDKVQAAGWSPAVLQLTLALYRDVQLGIITASSLPPLPLPVSGPTAAAAAATQRQQPAAAGSTQQHITCSCHAAWSGLPGASSAHIVPAELVARMLHAYHHACMTPGV
jgi:hypothetical protein